MRSFLIFALLFTSNACRDNKDAMDYRNMAGIQKSEIVQLLQTHKNNFEALNARAGLMSKMSEISKSEQEEFSTHVKSFQAHVDTTISHLGTIKTRIESLNIFSHHNSEKSIQYFIAFIEHEKKGLSSLDTSLMGDVKYFMTVKHHKDLRKDVENFNKKSLQDLPKIVNSLDKFKNNVINMSELN